MDNDKSPKDREPGTGAISDKDLEKVAGGITALATQTANADALRAPLPPLNQPKR